MGYNNKVSFSQFSLWNQCPHKWKLTYVDKIKEDKPSIHLIFGSAMHYVVQIYLTALYSNGASYADQLELREILRESLAKEYQKAKERYEKNFLMEIEDSDKRKEQLEKEFGEYVTKQEMIEFYYDGEKILDWFLKNRREFFNSVEEELVGIEYPLEKEINDGLDFIAYIDVLLKNKKTGKLRIVDLKMSTKGWGSYKKSDSNTTDQIVLYKAFYAKRFGLDVKNIDGEFLIMKRKLYEDIPYKQKRVIRFVPASGKPTINKSMERFNAFVDACFDDKGNYKKDGIFPKIATDNNCRFCPFKDRPELCDRKN